MNSISKSLYKHLEELEGPREDKKLGEYFHTADFEEFRESMTQNLDKEKVVSTFSDLRFLVNSLKTAVDQTDHLSDIVSDYESRQTNKNVRPVHHLSDSKQMRSANEELRFPSSNPFQQSLLSSSNRTNINEKQTKEDLGKMLFSMQNYLNSNLKEIKNIKHLVEPEQMDYMMSMEKKPSGSVINDENNFGEPYQSELKKFKEDIDNTERRVQEVQIQKLMKKIKEKDLKIQELQTKLEPLERERNKYIFHSQNSLCLGSLIITEHTDLGKFFKFGADKESLKSVTKFVSVSQEEIQIFEELGSPAPELVIPHKEVADLSVIDVLNVECNICFKLEYWRDGDIHIRYLHPRSEKDIDKWDIAFYALNIKKSISYKGQLLKNAALMQATIKAMEMIRSGNMNIENDDGSGNPMLNAYFGPESGNQMNTGFNPADRNKPILKKIDSNYTPVSDTKSKSRGTGGGYDQAGEMNSNAGYSYPDSVNNLFKRGEKRESSKKIQFAEIPNYDHSSSNNLSQFSRFNLEENIGEIPRDEHSRGSRQIREFQDDFQELNNQTASQLESLTPSPRKLRRGDNIENDEECEGNERRSILKNRGKKNSFEKDALMRKKSLSEEEQKIPRAIKVLKNGFLFLKYGKYGNPHERLVYLSEDEQSLEWRDANLKKSTGNIGINSITDIVEGRGTGHFHRFKVKDMNQERLSFSIVSPKRTLDLEASIMGNKISFLECLKIVREKK